MATIVDVARRAGVATSTVSHVLNQTRFVSPATTRAVRDAVLAVGYTPNTLARALARSTTNTVGLAVSASVNRYFSDIVNAIEEECAKLGMMVLLANTRDDPEEEIKVVAELHRRRVDGIILAPSGESGQGALPYLRDNAIPAVMVDRLPSADFDGVGVENRDAMASLVDHLARKGHRRIGVLAGQDGFTTTNERLEGFRAGLRRNGLAVVEALISSGHTDLRGARASAQRMIAVREAPTAFVGANNLTTIGVMHALRDAGLRVPTDVALVGFDDFEWSDYFAPRLTVMAQPCRDIGQGAAARLKQRMAEAAAPTRIDRLAPVLIVRDSCGGPAPLRS